MTRTLPIFPLDMVLFPGAEASLQIFEPRYREMLRDCMADDRRFGVVLIRRGTDTDPNARFFGVGTVATITSIGAPRRGAIPIEVEGESRFRIESESRVRPYLTAEVEPLPDDPNDTTSDAIMVAAHDATMRYLGTILASQGVYKAKPDVPADPTSLSHYMGMIATTASNRSLQRLLEMDTVTERLQSGIALLEEEADRIQPVFMRSGPGRNRSLFSTN